MKATRALWRCWFLVLVALLAAPPAGAQRPNDLRRQIDALYDAGRYQEAIPSLDALLVRQPRDIEAHIKRGNCYARLNQPERALVDYDWVIRFRPAFAPPYLDRGIAMVMLGRLDLAQADFTRVLRLYAASPWTTDPASTAYDSSWNYASIAMPENFDRTGRQRSIAHCGLGQVLRRLGRNEEAIVEYNLALQLYPYDANHYVGRAGAQAALGRFDPALADYDQALRMAPGNAHAIAARAELLARMGQAPRALDDLTQALRIDPGDVRARRVRAGLLSTVGRHAEALAELDMVLKAAPGDVGALKDRGGVLVRMGRPREAVAVLDEAIKIDPNRAAAYLNRGTAYNALGYPEQALRDLGEAIRIDPRNPVAHYSRAEVYARVHRFVEAIHGYEETLRLAPGHAPARAGLAGAKAALGVREPEQAAVPTRARE